MPFATSTAPPELGPSARPRPPAELPTAGPPWCPAVLAAVAAGGAFVLPGDVQASTSVNFGSTVNATNEQSDGAAMDLTFVFELGVFAGGFTPDGSNHDDWLDYWIALPAPAGGPAQAGYNDAFLGGGIYVNNFSGTAFIADNMSDPGDPLAPDQLAYMWGFTGREAEADPRSEEWILLGNDAWTLPATSSDTLPSTLDWAVSDTGTYAVMGAVNPGFVPGAGGGGAAAQEPHMQSAEATIPAIVIPEPSPSLLTIAAGCALAATRRRRRPPRTG